LWEAVKQGLQKSRSVSKLSLHDVDNPDDAFEKLLLSCPTTCISLSDCDLGSDRMLGVLAKMLSQNNGRLTTLELNGLQLDSDEFGMPGFDNLIAALKNASLESLTFTDFFDLGAFQNLVNAVPEIRDLRRIKLELFYQTVHNHRAFAQNVLNPISRNCSLEQIDIDAAFLTRDDQAALRGYADRNKRFRELLDSPGTVSVAQVPEILESAKECDDGLDIYWKFFRSNPNFLKRASPDRTIPSPSAKRRRVDA
jgi:hypothetical protein